jgi:WD40 repeat protein/serine/threonine protein kinase/DNA-binding XRE family transcriptional regulator
MEEIVFGHLVRERRRALDLTQDELARRVSCAAITVRKIEAGTLRPSQQVAERLAVALAVPPADRAPFVQLARRHLPDGRDVPLTPPTLPPAPEEVGLEDLSGRAIRGYQLGERIGSGGFGAVYRAVQPQIERDVAVKIILPRFADQPEFIRRFEAEAQLIARLEHPHIVPLYDYWREPGVAYLVMRLLRGGSLYALLQRGPPPLEQVATIVEQIGAALQVAHRAGVVHRDLKPANVLLDEEGNAYLADFGIAKDVYRSAELSFAGAFVGSPAYSSPEQIRAEPVSPQTDIYALGVLLYELLTGRRPFQGPTPASYLDQHLHAPIPPLAPSRPGLPASLDTTIRRATAKLPTARFTSVAELLAEVRDVLHPGGAPAPMAPAVTPTAAPPTELLDLNEADNPYQGLRPFDESSAAAFFGRESLVQQLLGRLGESGELSRFLAVIGPSGSGKSSVVRAGLLPALRSGGLPGSEQWYVVTLLPGAQPLNELAVALIRVAPAGVEGEDLLALLRADTRGLLRAARLVLPSDPAVELVLLIDQFEELFTLCSDEVVRIHLIESLVTAVLDPRSRLRILITLRADFIDRPLQYVDLGELLRQRSELVLPLTADELERAIVEPARWAGLALDDGLAATLVAAVANQPGVLPLLQHSLSELFTRRQGRLLTRAAYQESGGVSGALANSAERLVSGLDAAHQALVHQIFLRLTTPGEGAADTRRRTPLTELQSLSEAADRVIAAFGAAHFLTFDHDPLSRAPTVEVAHEALLREWPRLRGWLDAARADLRLQRRLAQEAAEWEQAGRAGDYLASGARLSQYEALAQGEAITLTQDERSYLEAALARRDRQAIAERERRERELSQAQALAKEQQQRTEAQRRAAQGLRILVAALTIFLLVAGSLAAFAVGRQREAEANFTRAEANFTRAEAQRLAAEANQIIARQGNSEVAALLALRSIRLQYTPQGDEAIGGAAGLEFARHILAGHPAGFGYAIWSPDSAAIFTGGADETIRRWDATTGVEQAQLTFPNAGAFAMTPSGDLLAVGYVDGVIELRDPSTLQPVGEFATLPGSVNEIVFSADGRQMLVSVGESLVQVYDVASRRLVGELTHPNEVWSLAISTDGRTAATGDQQGTIRIWNLSDGTLAREWQAHEADVMGIDISPDGQRLLSVSADNSAKYWDIATEELLYTRSQGNWLWGGDISPDGRRIVAVDDNATLWLWDAATGTEVRRYLGQYGILYEVQFSPDSRSILALGEDGTVRVYEVAPQSLPQFVDHPFGVMSAAIAPDSSSVVTGDRTGVLRLWDARTGQKRWEQQAHTRDIVGVLYLHGGTQVLTTSTDDTMRLWDAASGDLISSITKNIIAVAQIGFAVSHDERYVLTRSAQVSMIWEIATGTQVQQFDKPMANAIFMPDDTAAVTIYSGELDGGVVRIWDVSTGELIHEFTPSPGQRIAGLATTPDGKYLAIGIIDGVIQLWEYGTWRQVGQFFGHTGRIHDLVFSPDGGLLLSAGADRSARLWDVETRTELRRYVHEQPLFRTIAFTADGTQVLTAARDGIARLRHIDLDDTVADLCSRVQRDFTPEERAQYSIPDDGPTCPGSS